MQRTSLNDIFKERSEQYLYKASFIFEGWKHITKEALVERLNLPLKSEEFREVIIVDSEMAPYCSYIYTIPKNTNKLAHFSINN